MKRTLFATLLVQPGCNRADEFSSPYAPEDETSPFALAINEIHAFGNHDDPIELYSLETDAVDLEGFSYTDSLNNPDNQPFVFGPDTRIEGGQFMVLEGHSFGLREEGEFVALFDADNQLVDVLEWGAGEANESFCRVPDGTGEGMPCQRTMGAPNER